MAANENKESHPELLYKIVRFGVGCPSARIQNVCLYILVWPKTMYVWNTREISKSFQPVYFGVRTSVISQKYGNLMLETMLCIDSHVVINSYTCDVPKEVASPQSKILLIEKILRHFHFIPVSRPFRHPKWRRTFYINRIPFSQGWSLP